MEIFICEDDKKQKERITKYIKDYIMIEELDMRVALSTDNPDEIIEYVQSNNINGLYFLDVDLKHEKSGIVLGAEIRKYDSRGSIVFVTTHSELTYLTFLYKVEALDYIIKDDFTDIQKRVIDCIKTANERYMSNQNETKKRFQIKSGDKVISEEYSNILFFETSPKLHKIVMHTDQRQVEFYGKLKEIEELDDCFYRCHNSFVVNIENIANIDKKTREITMENGEVCFASSRYMKELNNLLK
ncbi:LytR/AlgR family response regulator transcription factor [Oceanobacillus piezotolerans]|uniref:LytR/AlgR family response regulator transcription factor n=1 Tax=Oceanobacillus piezotolerans TaxID=2448030 RepID=UPI001FE39C18|nr:LytTR family DNA-binding domain-containing protein [Oceanobacillus piezotolerans]